MVPRHRATVGSYGEGVSYERGAPVVDSRIPSDQPLDHLLSSSHLSSLKSSDPIVYAPRDRSASTTPNPWNFQHSNLKPFTVYGDPGACTLQDCVIFAFISTPGCPEHIFLARVRPGLIVTNLRYRGSSLIRKHLPPGLCSRPIRLGPYGGPGGVRFLMSEEPLHGS